MTRPGPDDAPTSRLLRKLERRGTTRAQALKTADDALTSGVALIRRARGVPDEAVDLTACAKALGVTRQTLYDRLAADPDDTTRS